MLLASKSLLRIFEFELSVPLSGENRSNKTPGVPNNTSQCLSERKGPHPFHPLVH